VNRTLLPSLRELEREDAVAKIAEIIECCIAWLSGRNAARPLHAGTVEGSVFAPRWAAANRHRAANPRPLSFDYLEGDDKRRHP
jgi:hypothetical protein